MLLRHLATQSQVLCVCDRNLLEGLNPMEDENAIRDAFRQQSDWCAKLGSPFTSLLMGVLADHLDDSTQTGKAILAWGDGADAMADAVPLRLAGALHAAVRAGRLPEIANCYPPLPLPTASILAKAVQNALNAADDDLLQWLQYAPQTNETARSAVLYSGFMVIAHKTGLPLHLYELGASAGLNLISDRYSYTLGGLQAGAAGAPLKLAPEWEGAPPPNAKVDILQRSGCDRAPLDVHNPDHCERLVAYVWPDQPQRLARVQSAIALAQRERVQLDQADAASWVEERISVSPVAGATRVLFHSIAWQYFGTAEQARITQHMENAGSNATAEAPLAWLAFEQKPEAGPRLSLRLWPTGDEQVLAAADAHVRKVTWY